MTTPERDRPDLRRRNRRLTMGLFALVFGMVGLSYASVPFYRLFCQWTGIGGTTQVADQAPGQILDRTVRVRFMAAHAPELPWDFAPEQREVTVRLGEPTLIYYRAANASDAPTSGFATYNVAPAKAGLFFVKTECFCFSEQVLGPGQSADLPVYFFVDPAMAADRNLDDLQVITLSYTFFPGQSPQADAGQDPLEEAGAGLAGRSPDDRLAASDPVIDGSRQEVR